MFSYISSFFGSKSKPAPGSGGLTTSRPLSFSWPRISFTKSETKTVLTTLPYDDERGQISLPGAVCSTGGQRFYTIDRLIRQREEFLKNRDTSFPTQSLASALDISSQDLLEFCSGSLVVSEDSTVMFPPQLVDRFSRQLQEEAAASFVCVETFCADRGLPYSWACKHEQVQTLQENTPDDTLVHRTWGEAGAAKVFITRAGHLRASEARIRAQLSAAEAKSEQLQIAPVFHPTAFLAFVKGLAMPQALVKLGADKETVLYVPRAYLDKKAEDHLKRIQTGEIPFLEHREFVAAHRDLFPFGATSRDYDRYKRATVAAGEIFSNDNYWLSPVVVRDAVAQLEAEYRANQFVDLNAALPELPTNLRPFVIDEVAPKLDTVQRFARVDGVVVSKQLISNMLTSAVSQAEAQAGNAWDHYDGFQVRIVDASAIIDSLSKLGSGRPVPKKTVESLYHKRFATAANNKFSIVFASHKESALRRFEGFWREQVLCPWVLYHNGFESQKKLSDPKTGLLVSLDKRMRELVQSSLEHARATGLLTGRTPDLVAAAKALEGQLRTPGYTVLVDSFDLFANTAVYDNTVWRPTVSDGDLRECKQELLAGLIPDLDSLVANPIGETEERTLAREAEDARLVLAAAISVHARLPGHELALVWATGKAIKALLWAIKKAAAACDGAEEEDLLAQFETVKAAFTDFGSKRPVDREALGRVISRSK